MPGKDGALTEQDFAHVQQWMAKQAGDHKCPICGERNWQIGQHLIQPVTLGENGSIQLGGIGYPNVILMSPCGYTRLMNAVVMGLLPANPEIEMKKD